MDLLDEIEKVEKLIELGRYKLALERLQSLLQEGANNMVIFVLMVQCELELHNIPAAERALKRSFELAPNESIVHFNHGMVELAKENFEVAEKAIMESIRLDPEEAHLFCLLARIRLINNQPKKAQLAIDRGLEIDPNDASLLKLRSNVQFRKLQNVEGIASLKAALEKDPTDPELLTAFGHTRLALGKYKEAEGHFISALQQDPNEEEARQGLAETYKVKWKLFRIFYEYGFSRWTVKLTWGQIILYLLIIKSVFLWGGFFILFLLFTWWGDVFFNSCLRLGNRSKHLLSKNKVIQSNYFILSNLLVIATCIVAYISGNEYFGKLAIILGMAVFFGIAMLEVELKRQRRSVALVGGIFLLLTALTFQSELFISATAGASLLLIFGMLFSFRAIGW